MQNKKIELKKLFILTSSLLLTVFALSTTSFFGIQVLFNVSMSEQFASAFVFSLPIIGYAVTGLAAATFVYIGLKTRFKVDAPQIRTQLKSRRCFSLVTIVLCALFISMLISTPLVQAETVATTGYFLATPVSLHDWVIGKYSNGNYFAINGSSWANMMTWPTPAPWALYTSNYTKVTELVLSSVTYGSVYMKEVPFDLALMNSISQNVSVIEPVNGRVRTFINSVDSLGSPFTVSVEGSNYFAQDSGNRYWTTSTNKTEIEETIVTALSTGGTIITNNLEWGNTTINSNITVIENYQGKQTIYYGNIVSYPTSTKPLEQPLIQKYLRNSTLINGMEDYTEWGVFDSATLSDDSSIFIEQTQGVRCSGSNAGNGMSLVTSIDVSDSYLSMGFYIHDLAALDSLQVICYVNESWADFFSLTLQDDSGFFVNEDWVTLDFNRADFTANGVAVHDDWATIGRIAFVVKPQSGKTVTATFDELRLVNNPYGAKVTLRFDDGLENTFTSAKQIMDNYGFVGVAAVNPINIGTTNYMEISELTQLQERGWDIISHSYSHTNLTTLSEQQIVKELTSSQRWLLENGFMQGSRFFVPPYHSFNSTVLDLVDKYYVGCQTLDNYAQSIPFSEPYRMVERISITSATSFSGVEDIIDWAVANDAWITLVFHSVEDYTADFTGLMTYINSADIEVVTFSEVFDDKMLN